MAVRRRKRGREENPLFNLGRGYSSLTSAPPFAFEGVVLHFFPLQADFEKLEKFVDGTINLAPDFAYFRPIAPMVLMISAYYPKMSMEEGNLGWTAQNELLFTIPVEWYKPVGREYEFKALAQYAPFVFVSDEASQVEGREVFGWPKVHGWLEPTVNNWVHNPRNPRELLNMKSHVFEHLYKNDQYEAQTVLQIFQQAPTSFSVFPPSVENPLNPWKALPTVIDSLSSTLRGLWDWGFNQVIRDPISLSTTMSNALDGMAEAVNSLSGNTINLKQMRDAQNPQLACYQAITNARMVATNFNQSGLLGDTLQLSGDLSGGYSIGISRYPSIPIIESLGLHVQDHDIGENDTATSFLKPIMPFWQDVDMSYSSGENIAWRAAERNGSRWRNRKYMQKMKNRKVGDAADGQKISKPDELEATADDPHLPLYVTEGSAGFQVAEGPFNFPDATFRVLPLLACKATLNEYLEGKNLLEGEEESVESLFGQVPDRHICFEAAEPKVYLTIATYGEMTAKRSNMGLWGETQVRFLIPVQVFQRVGKTRKPMGMGLVSAFEYSNSALGTTTTRELNGWPTVLSEITSLPNTWGESEGPFAPAAPLVQVKTSMPSAIHANQPFADNTLLEIVDGRLFDWQRERAWRSAADNAGTPLKDDVLRMAQKALDLDGEDSEGFRAFQAIALQVFGGRREVHEYSFKQFRDADAPERACYQGVVRSCASVRVKDFRPLDDITSVRIFDYPTQPIVQKLGLVHMGLDPNDEAPMYRLMACRPFYFRAHVTTRLGQVVCWRAGNRRWRSLAEAPRKIRDDVPGVDFVDYINTGNSTYPMKKRNRTPRFIDQKLDEWMDEAGAKCCLSEEQIVHALSGEFEPHMVLHAALSREWENGGAPRWFQEVTRRNQIQKLEADKTKDGDKSATAAGTGSEKRDAGQLMSKSLDERAGEFDRVSPHDPDVPGDEIRQLPIFVVPTDCMGPEEDRLFPEEERVPDELEPEYWTPPYPKHAQV